MTFAEDAVPNNASSAVITKGGRGTVPTGLEVSPTELYFGALVVGEDQLTRSFTVTNIGRKTLRINSVVLETESNQFSMVEAHPNLLKNGESFVVEIKYESDQPGLVVGVVYITTNEVRDPYKVTLSGRVISSLYLEEFADEFNAKLEQESWARATADSAEAGQRLLLQATMGEEIEAKITQERIARVTMGEAIASNVETLEARVDNNTSSIITEETARANADNALAGRIQILEASTGDSLTETEVRAWIETEAIARSNADEAEATLREQLGATLTSSISDVSAAVVVETNARVTAIEAEALSRQQMGSSIRTDIGGDITTTNARIDSEQTTRANADGALANRITTLEAQEVGVDSIARAAITAEATARANADGAQANQINTLIAQSNSVGNLIANSDLANLRSWEMLTNTTFTPGKLSGHNNDWHASPGGLTIYQDAPSDASTTTVNNVYYFPDYHVVEENKRYQYSAYLGAHRCRGFIYVAWYTSADVYISDSGTRPEASIAAGEASGGKDLKNFKRVGSFVTAPANAARARFIFSKFNTEAGQTNSYLFCEYPMLARARVGQTELDPYQSGVPVRNIIAEINEERVARANQDTALAQYTTDINTSLANNIAGVQVNLQSNINVVDGKVIAIGARYSAYTTVNGLIGGFSVYNTGADVGSWFDVDRFYVGRTLSDGIYPFEVVNGIVNIKTAVIGTARIGHLQLAGGATSVSNYSTFAATDANNVLGASLGIQMPNNGYIYYSGGYTIAVDPELASPTVKVYQEVSINITLLKNGTAILFRQSFARIASRKWVSADALSSIGETEKSFAGGLSVSAVASDVFTLQIHISTWRNNATTGVSGSLGTLSNGIVQLVGAYK